MDGKLVRAIVKYIGIAGRTCGDRSAILGRSRPSGPVRIRFSLYVGIAAELAKFLIAWAIASGYEVWIAGTVAVAVAVAVIVAVAVVCSCDSGIMNDLIWYVTVVYDWL